MRRPRAELDGLLAGIRARLELRRARGNPDPDGEREVEEAVQEVERRRWNAAEQRLIELDARLASEQGEVELTERPRGLVSYTPIGERGSPPTPDQDNLANRLKLVNRLLSLRQSEGGAIDDLLPSLKQAAASLRHGDRRAAQELLEGVMAELDRRGHLTRRREDESEIRQA